MRHVAALDDGHGMSTPGKRTPKFPDGTFMHENDFNRAVVAKCAAHLMRCGIDVLLTAPTDEDVPLRTRTDLANAKKASIFVSVHANALKDTWGNPKGIETLYFPGSAQGKRLAELLLKHLLKGTPLVNRGAKERGDLHVLRETRMPAALVECGFMDNPDEARLLMSDAYREECAEELAEGICEFLGVAYVSSSEKKERQPSVAECGVEVNGILLETRGFIRDNRSYVLYEAIGAAAGCGAGWDESCGKAILNNRVLDTTVIVGDRRYALATEVAAAIQYRAVWDELKRAVKFVKQT
ncbi:N-acetylmuramoyl-L-alanine amidase [Paenibacillus sp.]|uniref:N-acetylmuramoyl-L-alanine amidase family protein n=1 Tax=Paenibacillus sp. TaxID=58172 RepID=UPI002D69369B|nr:N-acetylmuramoyl-L-alanine amidase [Paenibacillus sp.]HZG88106.1 N-acetylmuramoyl-L-alanine amidase [Paenibacillus sp.]